MIGFYKHQYRNHVWVLEVTGEKNQKEVYARQYIPNGNCPEPYDTYKDGLQLDELLEDDWDKPHWLRITDDEAAKLIGNLAEQKTKAEYRNTEECKKWAEELAKALSDAKLSAYAYNGVVRISTARGGESTISRDHTGKLHGERTGYPDPD